VNKGIADAATKRDVAW